MKRKPGDIIDIKAIPKVVAFGCSVYLTEDELLGPVEDLYIIVERAKQQMNKELFESIAKERNKRLQQPEVKDEWQED